MAHFYGSIQGARGEATRLGGKASDMVGYVASWKGACRTIAYVNEQGIDCVRVELTTHRGRGVERTVYDGPIGELGA